MPVRAPTVGLVVAAALAVACGGALAQQAPSWVDLQINCVVATDTNEGVDVKLADMGERLRSLFSYTTYRLVSRQDGLTEFGTMVAFTLPGGRILNVQPRGVMNDMIAMQLVMFQGAEPIMTTELRLKNRGMLIVGGPRYEKGMLIISIAANMSRRRDKNRSPGSTATADASRPAKSVEAPAARP
ncbi:MAG: hypothetical protein ACREQB_12445 [Candidatus Binataceae bacterium]